VVAGMDAHAGATTEPSDSSHPVGAVPSPFKLHFVRDGWGRTTCPRNPEKRQERQCGQQTCGEPRQHSQPRLPACFPRTPRPP
jgi:hypothetical protein